MAALHLELPKQLMEPCACAIAELGVLTNSMSNVLHVTRLVQPVLGVIMTRVVQVAPLKAPLYPLTIPKGFVSVRLDMSLTTPHFQRIPAYAVLLSAALTVLEVTKMNVLVQNWPTSYLVM
jgi:hypothetical protein